MKQNAGMGIRVGQIEGRLRQMDEGGSGASASSISTISHAPSEGGWQPHLRDLRELAPGSRQQML